MYVAAWFVQRRQPLAHLFRTRTGSNPSRAHDLRNIDFPGKSKCGRVFDFGLSEINISQIMRPGRV